MGNNSGTQFICTTCGYMGKMDKTVKGHFVIEIILWICWLLPGLIYTIWRLNNKTNICPKCGKDNVVDAESPIGKKLVKEISLNNP